MWMDGIGMVVWISAKALRAPDGANKQPAYFDYIASVFLFHCYKSKTKI